MNGTTPMSVDEAIDDFRTSEGVSLREASETQPLMLVFLRHSGCPFCREAVSDIAKARPTLTARGIKPVIVLQGDETDARRLLEPAGLSDLPWVLDANRELYRAFGLKRAGLWQLAGPYVWVRTLQALVAGHRIGRAVGDAFQMPGVFVLDRGRVVASYRHRSQASRPDYCSLGGPVPSRP